VLAVSEWFSHGLDPNRTLGVLEQNIEQVPRASRPVTCVRRQKHIQSRKDSGSPWLRLGEHVRTCQKGFALAKRALIIAAIAVALSAFRSVLVCADDRIEPVTLSVRKASSLFSVGGVTCR